MNICSLSIHYSDITQKRIDKLEIVQRNKKVKQRTYSMSFNIRNKEITQVLKTHDMKLLADEY